MTAAPMLEVDRFVIGPVARVVIDHGDPAAYRSGPQWFVGHRDPDVVVQLAPKRGSKA